MKRATVNQLEDRLRSELPQLADGLLAAPADGSNHSADSAVELLTLGRSHDPDSGPSSRRVARWAVAAAVGLGIFGLGLTAVRLSQDESAVEAADETPTDFGTWSAIARAPIPPRPHAVTAWTGSEVVFWAGSSLSRGFAYSDGATYDPVTDTWDTMVVPGWGHPGLSSVFFEGEIYALAKGGGARFDPTAGEWHDLPEVEGMWLAATVATDRAIWGIGPRNSNLTGQPDLGIARYEPESDSWDYATGFEGTDAQAEIVTGIGRLTSTVAWSGTEIIIWGGEDGGIAFDPASESWRTVAPPQPAIGVSGASIAVSTDDGLALVVNVEEGDVSYLGLVTLDGSRWLWRDTEIPIDDFDSLTVAAGGDWLLGFSVGQSPLAIHIPSGAWHRHVNAPIGGVEAPNTAWTGDSLIIWGGVVDDDQAGKAEAGARWIPPR